MKRGHALMIAFREAGGDMSQIENEIGGCRVSTRKSRTSLRGPTVGDVLGPFRLRNFHKVGSALADPSDRFVGEPIESRHGMLQVLFFRVLDFVVGDAVEALDEHHDGGDAEAGDFGGVVEGAGREAMWLGADFRDGFVAERDEIVVKKDRLDLPEAFPGNGDVAFGGEAFAGFSRFGKHAGESSGVEMTLVERNPAFFDNAGNDAGFGGA
jgi:hypothetical protein